MTLITSSLSATPSNNRLDIAIDDRPVARIDHRDGAVHVWVSMLDGDRRIDVSTQPRTLPTMLRREARARREDPDRWCNGLAGVVYDAGQQWGFDDIPPSDRTDLEALLASLPFPLSLLARREGAGSLPHVPRWAAPTLRTASATAAAQVALGPTATRGAARALPLGMTPSAGAPTNAALDLRPLGFAISLADHLPPDRLASVLTGGSRWFPPVHWPTDEDVKQLRRLWRTVDEATATALAVEALNIEHGTARLRRALTIIEPFAAAAELALARRVVDLERQAAQVTPQRPGSVTAPSDGTGADRPFIYPPTIEIAHGYRIGDYRLVLPRSPAEMNRWRRRMSNCFPNHAGAIRTGRSVVIGLEERGTLIAALELRDGTVRQFVGIASSHPTTAHRGIMTRMMRDLSLDGR